MRTHIGQLLLGIVGTQLDKQNAKGFEKYKETLDDVEYEEYDWNVMVIEELIDGMQYMIKENLRLREKLQENENMNFKMYQEMSKRTMPTHEGFSHVDRMNKSNYALGLNGEAGELGEIVKKNVHHLHEFNRDKFVSEAGDVLHYLSGLCSMYDVTLEEVATVNIMKLKKRYPNGFNKMDSVNRVDVNKDYPTPEEFKRIVEGGYASTFQDEMNNMYKVDKKD